jgi:membrane protein
MVFVITVIAVSIDAYLASLAYCLKKTLSLSEVLYAASFTFFICLIALTVNDAFIEHLSFVKEVGALIFIFIGIKNYAGLFRKKPLMDKSEPKELWLLGLAVSADAGLACLSVEMTAPIIPLYAFFFFAAHFFFLLLGTLTVRLTGFMNRLSALSGVCLIALGLFKLFM